MLTMCADARPADHDTPGMVPHDLPVHQFGVVAPIAEPFHPLHEDFSLCPGCSHQLPTEELCGHDRQLCPTCCGTEGHTDRKGNA